jgi:spore coat protein JB
MSNRAMSLRKIQIIDFVLNDTLLFIDTHPNCKEAMEYYNNFLEMRKSAVRDYTSQYGALEMTDCNLCGANKWCEGPWPWEKRCCE